MKHAITRRVILTAALAGLVAAPGARAQAGLAGQLGAIGANVIFLRHALAPGFGDPGNFRLGDCTTQRNLSAEGRAQARQIGAQLAGADLALGAVLSSQWCRCLETARLLGLGPVEPFAGLNSFFQGHAPRGRTLALLEARLAALPQDRITVMVTHQVVISAATGLSVPSGGAVGHASPNGAARRLDLG